MLNVCLMLHAQCLRNVIDLATGKVLTLSGNEGVVACRLWISLKRRKAAKLTYRQLSL